MGNFYSKSSFNQEEAESMTERESPTTEKSKKRKLERTDTDEPSRKKQKIESNDKEDNENSNKSTAKRSSMTKTEFIDNAEDMEAICGERTFLLKARSFSTGSVGWFASGHEVFDLNESSKVATVLTISAVVNGSKKWKEGSKDEDKSDDEDDDLKPKMNTNAEGDTMTKKEFLSKAQNLKLECFGKCIDLKVKQSSKGSVGWNGNSRVSYSMEGHKMMVSISVNITVKKSKEWKDGEDE